MVLCLSSFLRLYLSAPRISQVASRKCRENGAGADADIGGSKASHVAELGVDPCLIVKS
jgi:hypothetical protein